MNKPVAQVYKTINLRNQNDIFSDGFWVKEPRHPEIILASKCCVYDVA